MDIINEWIETAKGVITDPEGFFKSESKRDGFGYPLKFAAVSIVLSAFLTAFSSGVRSVIFSAFRPVDLVVTLFGTLIGGLIGIFIWAAIVHILVYVFGGKLGYKGTLAVVAYTTALYPISAIASIVPILGALISLVVFVYAAYVQIRGLEEFQSLTFGQAALAVIVPYMVLALIAFIVAILAFAALFSIASFGGPTPPIQ